MMQAQKSKQNLIKREKESDDKSKVKKFRPRDKSEGEKAAKHKKRKRLIIRNLSFQVNNEELRETFSKFGNVVNVNIPLKEDGRKRGFAFVEFDQTKSLIKAMKALNQKEIHGRQVAIDFAIDKTNYQLKLQSIKQEKDVSPDKDKKSISESDDESDEEKPDIDLLEESVKDMDENEKRANDFLKEFDSGFETVQVDNDSSDECSSDNESEKDDSEKEEDENENSSLSDENDTLDNGITKKSNESSKEKFANKRNSHDVSEGKTVFIRNVSFTTTEEDLREAMERFGDCEYCKICIDRLTDHSKGSAFVKFKLKENADKVIQESMRLEPGILVGGRKLTCSPAVSKEVISQHQNESKKPNDKRNLSLLKVGLIMPNSTESEGVSPSDMAKRSQLEMLKKQKLKNVNFFVSDTRLMVHNIPKTLTDVKLRKLFKEAGGKGAVITEARVMRDFKKTSVAGIPLSKGFGFVSFRKHEDALKALTELNNNPNTFTSQKRPIVEFSVENRVALLSKERKKEKMKLRNQRRTEEKQERLSIQNAKNKKGSTPNNNSSKKSKKRKQKDLNSEATEENLNNSISCDSPKKKRRKIKKKNGIVSKNDGDNNNVVDDFRISETNNSEKKKKTKKKKKSQKKKENAISDKFNVTNFNSRVNRIKEKLLNKM